MRHPRLFEPSNEEKPAESPYVVNRVQAVENEWTELLYNMADGNAEAYARLKAMPIFEFYTYMAQWEKAIKQKMDALKQFK